MMKNSTSCKTREKCLFWVLLIPKIKKVWFFSNDMRKAKICKFSMKDIYFF